MLTMKHFRWIMPSKSKEPVRLENRRTKRVCEFRIDRSETAAVLQIVAHDGTTEYIATPEQLYEALQQLTKEAKP